MVFMPGKYRSRDNEWYRPRIRSDGTCNEGNIPVKIGSTEIEDTFAEAFKMYYVRLLVTAEDTFWLDAAVREATGYSASVIACDAEAGVEQCMDSGQTPDGRIGAAVLVFGSSVESLAKAVTNRVGQCIMTCPSTAVFDGAASGDEQVPLGKTLRFFGDGYQKSKQVAEKRFWRIPVMDGEFLVADMLTVNPGVAGGNIILQSTNRTAGLAAARRGSEAVNELPDVIAPFPGGVARSGSKVGSRYKQLIASTADAYCPSLRGRVESKLHPDANCAYEIVVDGIDEASVGKAMASAMQAIAAEDVVRITAGNYGGKLGKYHFHLHELLTAQS